MELIWIQIPRRCVARYKGEIYMANLKKANLKLEYIDIKEVHHKVEHLVAPSVDKESRERISEEVLQALTRPNKRIPA